MTTEQVATNAQVLDPRDEELINSYLEYCVKNKEVPTLQGLKNNLSSLMQSIAYMLEDKEKLLLARGYCWEQLNK